MYMQDVHHTRERGLETMKAILRDKAQAMGDRDLETFLSQFTKAERDDWRNWGDNVERMMAEELHHRGLLD